MAKSGCGGWRPADRQVVAQNGFGGVDLLEGLMPDGYRGPPGGGGGEGPISKWSRIPIVYTS